MEPLTEEQKEDVNTRVAEFRKRHIENVEELEVDFVSFPQYQQLQDGSFVTIQSVQPVDKKYLPIPSPFAEGVEGGQAQ